MNQRKSLKRKCPTSNNLKTCGKTGQAMLGQRPQEHGVNRWADQDVGLWHIMLVLAGGLADTTELSQAFRKLLTLVFSRLLAGPGLGGGRW
ncbi:hypothetical protein TYRP_008490 [Tyrophagus putrescentiae]|nr:hypothetical protein TYRP_008490 [Tyrophagus putrescentiae]